MQWIPLVPPSLLNGNSRNIFPTVSDLPVTHVRLSAWPGKIVVDPPQSAINLVENLILRLRRQMVELPDLNCTARHLREVHPLLSAVDCFQVTMNRLIVLLSEDILERRGMRIPRRAVS